MIKKIEFVPVTESNTLRDKLEEMVNQGWEIKGFVTFSATSDPHQSFAVMERPFADDAITDTEFGATERPIEHSFNPEPPKPEVSISVGEA
ncbi:MAG TPA: hypothetical protein VHO72_06295 [Bacteroidales bacterium]|nr:hypothetical protein [Bacteroidales bacterium]